MAQFSIILTLNTNHSILFLTINCDKLQRKQFCPTQNTLPVYMYVSVAMLGLVNKPLRVAMHTQRIKKH